MSGGRPDDKRIQRLTIGGYVFYRRDQGPLHRGPSMLSQIVFADEHLKGVENTEKNSRLVHIINTLWEDGRIS
ncbi:hypothetical protein N7462_006815 [Penicillium macrosclerotiorum]|uniref:uncharacterized protein n=1 Tax=Penicillium macrosclerotiorum TaxID=303699 RepID=UPI002547CAC7|nr:uncharacterized protein N7462_006815 [Penicillium macrosclerotiorum]KAJ5683650.1 hypothetical protein N7462_006815 [Penicillium macrosclerotiorum]